MFSRPHLLGAVETWPDEERAELRSLVLEAHKLEAQMIALGHILAKQAETSVAEASE